MLDAPVVAFLGTGAMGGPMARNVARAGLPLRAWNRTRERAEPLAADGAVVCSTPAQAAEGADVLVTMLSDGPAVAGAVAEALRPELLWLQMSTVGVEWADRLAETAAAAGATYVDAPVMGSVAPAVSGELLVLASGPDEARGPSAPVFDAVGRETRWLGPAGLGSRLKIVNNFWILGLIALGGEVVALADGLGLGGQAFLDAIRDTAMDAPYVQSRGPRMASRSYGDVGFRLALARKDVGLAAEAGSAHGLDLSVAEAIAAEMERAIARGFGDDDFSAVREGTSR